MARFVTTEQIILEARKNLHQGAWDYLVGGSESETAFRRNRSAFDRVALRPRVLADVAQVDTSTSFLGQTLRIPVLLAPVGSLQTFTPEAGVAAARAAAAFGTGQVVSSSTEPSLEEIATAGAKFFQLYIRGDDRWIEEMVRRVVAAGYVSLALTVDSAVYSRRERPMISGWASPSRRRSYDPTGQAALTWQQAEQIRTMAGLPFMLKGIQTAEDAAVAVERGVDVVWVSNHGGRQLDHTAGTMDMLPEIVAAAGGRARIVVDGGVQKGTDVIKAIALGADAVAIGRLQAWALVAAGEEGVFNLLEILEAEMRVAMGLMGVRSLSELSPRHVTAAEPVTPPHEMSSWPNIPGGRIR